MREMDNWATLVANKLVSHFCYDKVGLFNSKGVKYNEKNNNN